MSETNVTEIKSLEGHPLADEKARADIAELSEEMETLKENGAGVSITVDPTLTQEGQAADAKAVGAELKKTIKGVTVSGGNLFDKDAAILNKLPQTGTAGLKDYEGWCVSDLIKVTPGETYCATMVNNAGFYYPDKTWYASIRNNPFTVPDDVEYIRLGLTIAGLDGFMLVQGTSLPTEYLPYAEMVLSLKSFDSVLIKQLREAMNIPDNIPLADKLRTHLSNPFIRTQIKLVGDSITAGMGGTGYSAQGETIYSDDIFGTIKANVLTATCWSNMLYHYIDKRFNREFVVPCNDEHISLNMNEATLHKGDPRSRMTWAYIDFTNASANDSAIEFEFYGDHVGVYHTKGAGCGIFEVYVDGALKATVDCYSSAQSFRNEAAITGLENDKHTLRVRLTGTKNSSASAKTVTIEGFKIPKTAVVKPWGVSGRTSLFPIDLRNGLFSTDDDFVLMQFGTNDRHMSTTDNYTTSNLVEIGEYIKANYDAEVILLASCPSSVTFESDVPAENVKRYYHMWDVKLAVQKAADALGVLFIDNYDAFWRYCEAHDVELDSILADGLHPNDLGYEIMYKNVMRSLGLPLIPAEYDDIVTGYRAT